MTTWFQALLQTVCVVPVNFHTPGIQCYCYPVSLVGKQKNREVSHLPKAAQLLAEQEWILGPWPLSPASQTLLMKVAASVLLFGHICHMSPPGHHNSVPHWGQVGRGNSAETKNRWWAACAKALGQGCTQGTASHSCGGKRVGGPPSPSQESWTQGESVSVFEVKFAQHNFPILNIFNVQWLFVNARRCAIITRTIIWEWLCPRREGDPSPISTFPAPHVLPMGLPVQTLPMNTVTPCATLESGFFPSCAVLKAHPHCGTCQGFLPFEHSTVWMHHIFFILLLWTFGLFLLWATII